MMRVAAALAALAISACLILLSVYGAEWLMRFVKAFLDDVRVHGVPVWWHAGLFAFVVGSVVLRRRRKAARKRALQEH